MPLRNPLLPLSVLLLAIGLALPGVFAAGLIALGLWLAVTVAELVAGKDGATIFMAGIIVVGIMAWAIL